MHHMEISGKSIYIRHSDLRADGEKHLKLDICEELNLHLSNFILAAQQIGGIWKVWIKSDAARDFLLKKVVTFKYNNCKIELHDYNPFTSPQTPSEDHLP